MTAPLGRPTPDGRPASECGARWPVSLRALLGEPVRAGDLAVGRVEDVLLTADLTGALGCCVRRNGGETVVLPWLAASVERDGVRVRRRLPALGLDWRSGVRATALVGRRVAGGGTLADVLVDALARVVGVAVGRAEGSVVVGPRRARRLLAGACSGGLPLAPPGDGPQRRVPLARETAEPEA